MPNQDLTDVAVVVAAEIAKNVPVKQFYGDALSPAMKEVGGLLADTVKCVRLVGWPIQGAAYLQDRWIEFAARAKAKVQSENLIMPPIQILGPILDGVRFVPEGSITDEALSELLARAFDRERVGQAHPAFPGIVRSLADDEFRLLRKLRAGVFVWTYGITAPRPAAIDESIWGPQFPEVEQISNLDVYLKHLGALGLIGDVVVEEPYDATVEPSIVNLRLTSFGELFVQAVYDPRMAQD